MSSGDQSAQRQFGQQADLQKWSSFTDQCLGPSLNRANTTISGTVRSVGTLYTNENADAPDGRRLVVQTRENDRVTVYTGPMGQVSDPLQLSRGDEVTIRGSECQIENRTVFVAATIETDNQTYRLTERNGIPSWSPESQQQRGGRR